MVPVTRSLHRPGGERADNICGTGKVETWDCDSPTTASQVQAARMVIQAPANARSEEDKPSVNLIYWNLNEKLNNIYNVRFAWLDKFDETCQEEWEHHLERRLEWKREADAEISQLQTSGFKEEADQLAEKLLSDDRVANPSSFKHVHMAPSGGALFTVASLDIDNSDRAASHKDTSMECRIWSDSSSNDGSCSADSDASSDSEDPLCQDATQAQPTRHRSAYDQNLSGFLPEAPSAPITLNASQLPSSTTLPLTQLRIFIAQKGFAFCCTCPCPGVLIAAWP